MLKKFILKRSLKQLVILLVFALLVANCEEDNSNHAHEHSDKLQDIITRELPFEKLPNFNKVSNAFNKLHADLNSNK